MSMRPHRDLPRRLLNLSLMAVITMLENLHVNQIPLKSWFMYNAKRYGEVNKGSGTIGYALSWCFNSPLHPVRYPKDSVFPIQYVPFEDTELPIPRDPHVMLAIEVAKNHMELPSVEARKPKHIKDAVL